MAKTISHAELTRAWQQYMNKHPNLRKGQALSNVASLLLADDLQSARLLDQVIATEVDPYFVDERIDKFVGWLYAVGLLTFS